MVTKNVSAMSFKVAANGLAMESSGIEMFNYRMKTNLNRIINLQLTMEKVNSKFWFKNKYQDKNGSMQDATVVLDINYRQKTYDITPYCGTVNDGFKFVQTSHKWKMWKALTKSIDEAIDFANNELGLS